MKFNTEMREKQLEYLDRQDTKETMGSSCAYLIEVNKKVVDRCNCAGTVTMLLSSTYSNTNVFIRTIWGQN